MSSNIFSQANNVMISEFKKVSGIHDDCVCHEWRVCEEDGLEEGVGFWIYYILNVLWCLHVM